MQCGFGGRLPTGANSSRTSDHYDGDPRELAERALATDCIISVIVERCPSLRLNRDDQTRLVPARCRKALRR